MMKHEGYTLVRHSAWTYNHDPSFKQAVELRHVDSAKMRDAIVRAGGTLVRTYEHADALEEMINYPKNLAGVVPKCEGSFNKLGDTLIEIWVP
jgi:hypothetical protein